ncbi:hypothetical protein AC244_17360 [Ensifer adhaerens]|uniref:Uncharacterized protein n=1 Tax=Ensifer adhaerens TaxID=106592 RepID=A0A0L8BRY8_ENSAD|nr:hypothetical protein AC244_17360 [Ensifer adhaerens]
MISLHDLYNFRLPRSIGERPEHQRIGLRTAPDLHSTLHGPNEAVGSLGRKQRQTIDQVKRSRSIAGWNEILRLH